MGRSEALYSNVFDSCPEDWNVIPFEQAVDFREGPGILAKDFRDDGVPLLRLRNIERPYVDMSGSNFLDPEMVERKWSHFRVEIGDLLVSTSGTLGRVSIATDDAAGSIPYTGIIRMRPAQHSITAGFIRYFLTSPIFQQQAEASAAGSVLRHFGPSHLREMSFPVPPPEEQEKIADILGTLDDKIELNHQMNRTLEAMARAIFKAWFVDFEPVKAKAAGATSFRGMPQAVFDQLPDRFTDTELGPVPEGWEVGELGQAMEHPRRTIRPAELDEETPYIGLEHMPQKSIALTEWGRVGSVTSNKHQFNRGELLFGKLRPYFHKVGIAPVDGVCSTDVVVIRPKGREWFGYVLGHVSSSDYVSYANAASTGTKMPRTNWNDMTRYEVVLPDSEVAHAYSKLVSSLVEWIGAGIYVSHTLAAIRDALLPKLISGELRVPVAKGGADGG